MAIDKLPAVAGVSVGKVRAGQLERKKAAKSAAKIETKPSVAKPDLSKVVELGDGSYVDKESFEKLPQDSQEIGKTKGLLALQADLKQKQIDFEAANVKIAGDTYISKESFESLSPELQEVAKTQGLEAVKSQIDIAIKKVEPYKEGENIKVVQFLQENPQDVQTLKTLGISEESIGKAAKFAEGLNLVKPYTKDDKIDLVGAIRGGVDTAKLVESGLISQKDVDEAKDYIANPYTTVTTTVPTPIPSQPDNSVYIAPPNAQQAKEIRDAIARGESDLYSIAVRQGRVTTQGRQVTETVAKEAPLVTSKEDTSIYVAAPTKEQAQGIRAALALGLSPFDVAIQQGRVEASQPSKSLPAGFILGVEKDKVRVNTSEGKEVEVSIKDWENITKLEGKEQLKALTDAGVLTIKRREVAGGEVPTEFVQAQLVPTQEYIAKVQNQQAALGKLEKYRQTEPMIGPILELESERPQVETGYNISEYLIENNNDESAKEVLVAAGFQKESIDNATSEAQKVIDAKADIESQLKGEKVLSGKISAITDAVYNAGYYDTQKLGATLQPIGMTNQTQWVDTKTGKVLSPQDIAQRQWETLTDEQKNEVAILYNEDLYKGNYFAEQTKILGEVSEMGDIAGSIAYSPVFGVALPIAKASTGQKVEPLEIAGGVATGVADVLMLGGGGLLSGLGTKAASWAEAGLWGGTGVVGTTSTVMNAPKMSKGELIVSSVFDVLAFLPLGAKGVKFIKPGMGEAQKQRVIFDKTIQVNKEFITEKLVTDTAEAQKAQKAYQDMADKIKTYGDAQVELKQAQKVVSDVGFAKTKAELDLINQANAKIKMIETKIPELQDSMSQSIKNYNDIMVKNIKVDDPAVLTELNEMPYTVRQDINVITDRIVNPRNMETITKDVTKINDEIEITKSAIKEANDPKVINDLNRTLYDLYSQKMKLFNEGYSTLYSGKDAQVELIKANDRIADLQGKILGLPEGSSERVALESKLDAELKYSKALNQLMAFKYVQEFTEPIYGRESYTNVVNGLTDIYKNLNAKKVSNVVIEDFEVANLEVLKSLSSGDKVLLQNAINDLRLKVGELPPELRDAVNKQIDDIKISSDEVLNQKVSIKDNMVESLKDDIESNQKEIDYAEQFKERHPNNPKMGKINERVEVLKKQLVEKKKDLQVAEQQKIKRPLEKFITPEEAEKLGKPAIREESTSLSKKGLEERIEKATEEVVPKESTSDIFGISIPQTTLLDEKDLATKPEVSVSETSKEIIINSPKRGIERVNITEFYNKPEDDLRDRYGDEVQVVDAVVSYTIEGDKIKLIQDNQLVEVPFIDVSSLPESATKLVTIPEPRSDVFPDLKLETETETQTELQPQTKVETKVQTVLKGQDVKESEGEKVPPRLPSLSDDKERQKEIIANPPEGTVVAIQGRPTYRGGTTAPMFKVIVPPYTEFFSTRQLPKGYVDEGFKGKGSAFKSVQVLGGKLPHDIEGLDLGVVKVNIRMQDGKPVISYAQDVSANVGSRSQTVGYGRGQIPLEEWDKAKAQGVGYEDFVANYEGHLVGEEPKTQSEIGENVSETNVDYQKLYNDLVQQAAEMGIIVKDVPYEELSDYAAMHPVMAKQIGYEMPDNEIHMNEKWNTDIRERYQNLRHELEEMADMQEGEDYWSAHNKALVSEVGTDLDDIEMPATKEQPVQEVVEKPKDESQKFFEKQEVEPVAAVDESSIVVDGAEKFDKQLKDEDKELGQTSKKYFASAGLGKDLKYQFGKKKVYAMDDSYVRDVMSKQYPELVDFTKGGSHEMYPNVIPEGEYWVSKSLPKNNFKSEAISLIANDNVADEESDEVEVIESYTKDNPKQLDRILAMSLQGKYVNLLNEAKKYKAKQEQQKSEVEEDFEDEFDELDEEAAPEISRKSSRPKVTKDWWDDQFYSSETGLDSSGNIYRGRRLLPPTVGGNL